MTLTSGSTARTTAITILSFAIATTIRGRVVSAIAWRRARLAYLATALLLKLARTCWEIPSTIPSKLTLMECGTYEMELF